MISPNIIAKPNMKFSSSPGAPEVEIPPRPTAIEPQLDLIPIELRERNQWVCWRYSWERGRWNKKPINAETGIPASSTGVDTWRSFECASKAYESGNYEGIGYAFAADDP